MTAKNLRRVSEVGTCAHVYNKGVEDRTIFTDEADYQVFLGFLEEYLSTPKSPESNQKDFTINGRVFRGVPHQPKNYFKKVELIAYNLKPNHFHLLLHQKTQKSLQAFIRSLCTRYSIYFNKKYNRTGALFDGPYKSVHLEDEKGLKLLTHYLHQAGNYSTYPEYSGQRKTPWVKTNFVLLADSNHGNLKDYDNNYKPNQEEQGLLDEITFKKIDRHLDLERRDLEIASLKPWARIRELTAASVIFVLLLGIGLRNVTSSAKSQAVSEVILGTNTTTASPTPTVEPKAKTTVTIKNAEDSVNIREKPTTQSKVIGKAKNGDILELVSKNSGWYQIHLPDNSTGFISSIYIETGVINSQSND